MLLLSCTAWICWQITVCFWPSFPLFIEDHFAIICGELLQQLYSLLLSNTQVVESNTHVNPKPDWDKEFSQRVTTLACLQKKHSKMEQQKSVT